MKLIFIHGAPASGKLTVAKALQKIVPAKLFDNHAAIDFAKSVLDLGAQGFWELVHSANGCGTGCCRAQWGSDTDLHRLLFGA